MINMKKNKANLIVFIMLLLSQDSLIYGPIELQKYYYMDALIAIKYVLLTSYVCMCVYSLSKKGTMILNRKCVIYTMFLLSYIVLSMIVNLDYEGRYVLVAILVAFFSTNVLSLEEFIVAFKKVMLFIAAVSSVVHFCFILSKEYMNLLYSKLSSLYLGDILGRYLIKCYDPVIRTNAGIFRERGVFCFYLSIAIVCVLACTTDQFKTKTIQLIVLGLAMLTTKGSSGFVAVFLLMLGYIVYFPFYGKYRTRTIIFTSVLTTIMVLYFRNNYEILYLKLNANSALSDSGITRYASMVIALKAIIQNPILGIGVKDFNLFFRTLIVGYAGVSSRVFTNTILGIGAYWGLPVCFITVLGIYRFSEELKIKKMSFVFVFGAILVSLFCQSEVCVEVFWCMVLYGLERLRPLNFE